MTYGITWECYRSKWLAMYLELLACGDWIYVFLDSDLIRSLHVKTYLRCRLFGCITFKGLLVMELHMEWFYMACNAYGTWWECKLLVWHIGYEIALPLGICGLCTLVELCNIAVCLLTNVLSKVRKFIAILEILDLADFLRNSFVVTVDSSNQPVLLMTLVSMELKNTTCFINTHKTQMWLKHDPLRLQHVVNSYYKLQYAHFTTGSIGITRILTWELCYDSKLHTRNHAEKNYANIFIQNLLQFCVPWIFAVKMWQWSKISMLRY